MNFMSKVSDIARSPGDPTVIATGPSSRGLSDTVGKQLGWVSIGLGMTEIFGARQLCRALGMEGREGLVRAYGFREIASGLMCMSTEERTGVWSRVAGDALDIATLASAYKDGNPKKQNVGIALAAVAGITLVDLVTAQALSIRHTRHRGEQRDYSDRSGFPNGVSAARGAAAGAVPDDMRATPGVESGALAGQRSSTEDEAVVATPS